MLIVMALVLVPVLHSAGICVGVWCLAWMLSLGVIG